MKSIVLHVFLENDVIVVMTDGCVKMSTQREIIGAGCSYFYALSV